MIEAIVLAIALAMDVSAVAAARGLLKQRRELVALPLLFGAFHAAMATGGWLLGEFGGAFVAAWDHWIAFALLSIIGTRMVIDALRNSDDAEPREGGIGLYLVLALATSIDAFAAGITLPLLPAPPPLSIVLIGSIVMVCSFVAYLAGRAVGGKRLEIVGGLILVGLGVKILAEHL